MCPVKRMTKGSNQVEMMELGLGHQPETFDSLNFIDHGLQQDKPAVQA